LFAVDPGVRGKHWSWKWPHEGESITFPGSPVALRRGERVAPGLYLQVLGTSFVYHARNDWTNGNLATKRGREGKKEGVCVWGKERQI
jgi:hypothetical protein